ncbi:MAG: glycosyltransferase [Acidobacteriia bacterium]|nr:glycosyltransferase [Terriglobia bacterium]
MIVRDAQDDLAPCLESVRGLADEIVVADTGSVDRTCEVARRFGARVISVPWEDDFAKARNACLAEVTANWVLVLDADEQLDCHEHDMVRAHLSADCCGYLVTIRNYVENIHQRLWDRPAQANDGTLARARNFPAFVEHENVRLFRRMPEIKFVGRVHESVGPTIVGKGRHLEKSAFRVHHFGLVAGAERRAQKNRFYRELGRKKIAERPNDAQAHFELGLVEFDNFHEDEIALQCFRRACELNPGFGVAWLFAAIASIRLEKFAAALDYAKRAQARGYESALVFETMGDAHYGLKDFRRAARSYRQALRASGSPSLISKLGLVELRAGDVAKGLQRLREALKRDISDEGNHDRLIVAHAYLGNLGEAATAAEMKMAVSPSPKAFLRAASIRAQQKHWFRARQIVEAGLQRYPAENSLLEAVAELRRRELIEPLALTGDGMSVIAAKDSAGQADRTAE